MPALELHEDQHLLSVIAIVSLTSFASVISTGGVVFIGRFEDML